MRAFAKAAMGNALAVAAVSLIAGASTPAQRNWVEYGPFTPGPTSGYQYPTLTYDAARGKTVLFGAESTSSPEGTWEWDGAAWTQPSTFNPAATTPGPAAYDSVRQRVVFYDGTSLWEWDGTTWTQRASSTSPPSRDGKTTAVAYDSRRGRLVMFGGRGQCGTFCMLSDTWEWDGSTWTQRVVTTGPSPRTSHGMAYDESRGRVVLFGGDGPRVLEFLSDTWEWDGTAWVDASPPSGQPQGRSHPAMAYDSLRRRVVVSCGYAPSPIDDSWEWDGSQWTNAFPNASPGTHPWITSLTYDSSRAVLVGYRYGSNISELASTPAYLPYGLGCAGTAGTPLLSAAPNSVPQVGSIFVAKVTNLPPSAGAILHFGVSNTSWGPVQLPIALDIIGMTGCAMYCSGEFAFPLFNEGGTATWTFLIPSYPGVSFYNQAVVFDAGANPFGLTLSNAARGIIGV